MAGELLDEVAAHDAADATAALAQAAAEAPSSGYAPAPSSSSYRPPKRGPKRKSSLLKASAAPILLTVGALLLVPGVWALMLLSGRSVWQSDREDAASMAKVMLACLPLGLILISSAVVFFVQLRAETPRRGEAV
jgi:hypothetical protein